ncbi:MAG: CAP domain-containing protein [Dehalococcoidia bacterium]
MIRSILAIAFIVFLAELVILFSTGILEVNLAQPVGDAATETVAPPPQAPPPVQLPTLAPLGEAVPTPAPKPVPLISPASPPAAIPPVPIAVSHAPAPRLLPSQVFAMYDGDQITIEEAKTMLAELAPRPASTLERGSTAWVSALAEQVHALVNQERQNASLERLDRDHALSAIARSHSRDMSGNGFFAHHNPAGKSPAQRGIDASYLCYKNYGSYFTQGIGENIFQTWLYSSTTYLNGAARSKDYLSIEELARQIVQGWMDSPDHRKNILNNGYSQQGIGVVVGPEERVYITQNFC